jgi:hypothetical protein
MQGIKTLGQGVAPGGDLWHITFSVLARKRNHFDGSSSELC